MSVSPAGQRLPLFPLHQVLFPEGLLPLRVFEPRYMDMVTRCLRQNETFGVCLIAAGQEVGEAALPHPVGTAAQVVGWDLRPHDQTGRDVLHITVRGTRRFRLIDHEVEHDALLVGTVQWLDEPPHQAIPPALGALVPLLQVMLEREGIRVAAPLRLDDAAWVGARYAELLPIPALARQKLLELDDVVSRLEIVFKYLAQRNLV